MSHLSSFRIVEVDEAAVGTQFQALSIDNIKKSEDSIISFKDAQQVIKKGPSNVRGQVIDLPGNKNITGMGFSLKKDKNEVVKPNVIRWQNRLLY